MPDGYDPDIVFVDDVPHAPCDVCGEMLAEIRIDESARCLDCRADDTIDDDE